MDIRFSVIIATYNRADLLPIAISSVLQQSYSNWELIIIDDGSTDRTKEVIATQISDKRVTYIYQENKGRSAARNHGIDIATGDYLCFLDSDDFYLPNHLVTFKKCIQANENQEAFYFGQTYESVNGELKKFRSSRYLENENVFNFIYSTTIGAPRTCLPCDLLKRNKFDPAVSIGEDTELWLRLMPMKIVEHSFFTQAFLTHENRSVNNGDDPVFKDIDLKKQIDKKYRGKISCSIILKTRAYSYLKIARINVKENRIRSIMYAFKSLFSAPLTSLKEKVFIILQNLLP